MVKCCINLSEHVRLRLPERYRSYSSAGQNPELVEFGGANYLTIEGIGEPVGKMFVSKIEAW